MSGSPFASVFSRLVKESGKTNKEIAAAIPSPRNGDKSTDQTHISRVRRGIARPSDEFVAAVCKLFPDHKAELQRAWDEENTPASVRRLLKERADTRRPLDYPEQAHYELGLLIDAMKKAGHPKHDFAQLAQAIKDFREIGYDAVGGPIKRLLSNLRTGLGGAG